MSLPDRPCMPPSGSLCVPASAFCLCPLLVTTLAVTLCTYLPTATCLPWCSWHATGHAILTSAFTGISAALPTSTSTLHTGAVAATVMLFLILWIEPYSSWTLYSPFYITVGSAHHTIASILRWISLRTLPLRWRRLLLLAPPLRYAGVDAILDIHLPPYAVLTTPSATCSLHFMFIGPHLWLGGIPTNKPRFGPGSAISCSVLPQQHFHLRHLAVVHLLAGSLHGTTGFYLRRERRLPLLQAGFCLLPTLQ